MHVSRLGLTDFRSYPEALVELDPGPSTLVGPNGQGKTNLVEAIGYVATLGSHRVATDAPLVRSGAERAIVRCEVQRDGRATLVELEITPGKANRARVNRSPVPRAKDVLGALRTVLFAPEDLALVKGDPHDRRAFLDALLIARTPRYHGVKADYDRVLKQRNALLKSAGFARGGADFRTLDVWDEHLARHGAELLEAALLSEVSNIRKQELERGISLVGPHRDELVLAIGDLPAKGYASHGESWSLALALRIASHDLLTADGGEPVLVLDDVFAELDSSRRERLAALVAPREQVLITAAVIADVPEELQGARYDVAAGQVTRVR